MVLACIASLIGYGVLFGFVLDRPLDLAWLRVQIEAKLAHGAALPSPKLVILAGSNGPYSHRCAVIGPLLHMPCVNAGVAVGVGLDYLFARWTPLLRARDVVYLPMEEQQYARSADATEVGPDAAIMFRHDWRTLAKLPTTRWLGAFFAFDLPAAATSVVETAAASAGIADARATGAETNAWGDHVGHTRDKAEANAGVLAAMLPMHETADAVARGGGAAVIARFVREASAHGVRVIGGLPTGFADSPPPPATIAAIREIYEANGGTFAALSNLSRYPRADFYDSPDHLNEEAQIAHSRAIAALLAERLTGVAVSAR